LENLHDDDDDKNDNDDHVDISRAWENIRILIASATETLSYYEMKQHKS
jgi:hypothetical protein